MQWEVPGRILYLSPTVLPKGDNTSLCFWIILGIGREHADPAHALALLRARRERPRRRAAKQDDDLTPPDHSITSSARASSETGTSRPSALAALRLMTSSYLVGA
jgi:hypothetical protein